MQELRIEMLRRATITLIVCSLLVAAVIASSAFSIQRIGAQAAEDVDVEVVSITPVVYKSAVYVWNGQMRIGNGDSSIQSNGGAAPAVLVYLMNLSRNDNNAAVPSLVVDVLLERVNLTNSPAETFSIVNSTSVLLAPGQVTQVTLTWYEDGNTSKLAASPKGVTWRIGCLANITSPGVNDTDLNNNLLWNGDTIAYTGLVGDANGDGIVDIFDAIILSACFGAKEGDSRYNPDCNFNKTPDPVSGKQIIDIFDAILLASNFQKHMP